MAELYFFFFIKRAILFRGQWLDLYNTLIYHIVTVSPICQDDRLRNFVVANTSLYIPVLNKHVL